MSGLKYERFLVKMSLEQKLKLITSTEFYKSSSVDSFDFPVFEIKKQPYDESVENLTVTQFPNDVALASAWNPALTDEVYNAIGQETRLVNSFGYFNCSNDLAAENICSDNYVLAQFLAGKVSGLKRGGGLVNFEDTLTGVAENDFLRRNVRDTVLNNVQPDSYITQDINEYEKIKRRYKYDELLYGVVSTVEEALDFLYTGASFLFLERNIFDKLLNKLNDLTASYKIAERKFVNNRMTESSFARLLRNFKIFSPDVIDKACDNIIGILLSMKAGRDAEGGEYRSFKGDRADFDVINHDALAVAAARQTAVLIKNDENVLPINTGAKVAMLGECAKDVKYVRDYYTTLPTIAKLPFEVINDHDINAIGFALGYVRDEEQRSDIIAHAKSLCDEADKVLVYLGTRDGEKQLPSEQLELLDEIYGRKAKIIAIVSSDGDIDISFADKCSAVILTYAGGQGCGRAVMEIISGDVPPSGRLAAPVGFMYEGSFNQKYPFGYGLSYGKFEYLNLKVNETGVSFTVKNVSDMDGFAVPQLYVKKKNTQSIFTQSILRGFKKVFVKAGDAVRVKIPFDDLTFRLYSEEKGYYIEGGLYTISVCEDSETEKLSGLLLLKEFIEKENFRSDVVETSDNGKTVDFSESSLPQDVSEAKKKLPFALKLFLSILMTVYVDGILCLFAFSGLVPQTWILYVVVGVIAVAANVLFAVYVAKIAKERKKQKYLHPNDVLSDMIDNVGDFTELVKVKYRQPVADPNAPADDIEEVGESEDEEEEPEEELSYEVSFDEKEEEPVVYAERVSFPDLCTNLRDFVLTRGINLETASARVLLAAEASAKIVFLTSKNKDLLPNFVKTLSEYYGNSEVVECSDGWLTSNDILWRQQENRFIPSAFANILHSATKAREKQHVVIINNVSFTNLGLYFGNFIDYANHPSEEHNLKLNETVIKLPDNIVYVLVPQDGSVDAIPSEMMNGSIVAEVLISEAVETPAEAVEPKVVSRDDFEELLKTAKEECFIDEDVWKKVDALAENIGAGEKFAIGNKNTLQMESFSSVIMECGGDEADAVVNVFLAKLVYILKNTHMYKKDGGEQTLFALIEKLFTDEDLTKIQRALVKTVKE